MDNISAHEQEIGVRLFAQDMGLEDKLRRIIEVMRSGQVLTREQKKEVNEVVSGNNRMIRTLNLLTRTWQVAHPQLALFVRGLSALGRVGHAVLSIVNSLTLIQIRNAEQSRNLAEAAQEMDDAYAIWQKNLKEFGATADETAEALGIYNEKHSKYNQLVDETNLQKIQDIATYVGAFLTGLGQIGNIATAIAAFRALRSLGLITPGATLLSFLTGLTNLLTIAPGTALLIGINGLAGFLKTSPDAKVLVAIQLIDGLIRLINGTPEDRMKIFDSILKFFEQFKQFLPTPEELAELEYWAEFIVKLFVEFIPVAIDIFVKTTVGTMKQWVKDVGAEFVALYDEAVGIAVAKFAILTAMWQAFTEGRYNDVYELAQKLVHGSVIPEMYDAWVEETEQNFKTLGEKYTQFVAYILIILQQWTQEAKTLSNDRIFDMAREGQEVERLIERYERLARRRGGGGNERGNVFAPSVQSVIR